MLLLIIMVGRGLLSYNLVCPTLVACILASMGISAQNQEFQFQVALINITYIMALAPCRITEIIRHFIFPPNNCFNNYVSCPNLSGNPKFTFKSKTNCIFSECLIALKERASILN